MNKSSSYQHSQTFKFEHVATALNLRLIFTIKLLNLPPNGHFCTRHSNMSRRFLVVPVPPLVCFVLFFFLL